jgi:BMFP domain-containing protein YqiC
MIQNRILEQINEQVSSLMRNSPFRDMEKNIKAIVLAIFNKLDLVTREEFDIQQKVLVATRQKLEELEQKVAELSK